MRVSGIKEGAPRASPLPQDMLYTVYCRYILSGGKGEQQLHAWYKLRSSDDIYILCGCLPSLLLLRRCIHEHRLFTRLPAP